MFLSRTEAWLRAACRLGSALGWLACSCEPLKAAEAVTVAVSEAGDRVVIEGDGEFMLRRAEGGAPLLGQWEREAGRMIFLPALPLPAGKRFALEWTGADGDLRRLEFQTAHATGKMPAVELRPSGVMLPANALKLYLHFSEPMEQGVFLDRLRLFESGGREVVGPFRETELWSPDGRRLTVWFHPGRQKTGVNLNIDEGPVMRAGTRYRLVVSGTWRTTAGVALGSDRSFEWEAGAADHAMPAMEDFRLAAPVAGSRDPLVVSTDEALDPGVFVDALRVRRSGRVVAGHSSVSDDGCSWRFVPDFAWLAGEHQLQADPHLEDLAGNSLTQPFEVDVEKRQTPQRLPLSQDFTIR